jgi:hypothetical protein
MKCECGNHARYITSEGALTCSLCAQIAKVDSIRIAEVPTLLAWARAFLSEENRAKVPTGKLALAQKALREIVGKDLSK